MRTPLQYDDVMKRITISLPDELVDKIKRAAGEGHVSAYIAEALVDYTEQESLAKIFADWRAETPVSDEIHREVEAELDAIGLSDPRQRRAG
jgi:metal-responsive CopG/Arc/MetJ family transcriptional regulator